MRRFRPRFSTRRSSMLMLLASLLIFLAVGAATQSYGQAGSKKWIANDVKQTLSKLPWTSSCCFEFHDPSAGPSMRGITVSIVSSQSVREALVTRMKSDKHYEKLDPAHREEVDQRIAS